MICALLICLAPGLANADAACIEHRACGRRCGQYFVGHLPVSAGEVQNLLLFEPATNDAAIHAGRESAIGLGLMGSGLATFLALGVASIEIDSRRDHASPICTGMGASLGLVVSVAGVIALAHGDRRRRRAIDQYNSLAADSSCPSPPPRAA